MVKRHGRDQGRQHHKLRERIPEVMRDSIGDHVKQGRFTWETALGAERERAQGTKREQPEVMRDSTRN